MAKLLLKGVMWGSEKVPEDWYGKVHPGNYINNKNSDSNSTSRNGKNRSDGRSDRDDGNGSNNRRHSIHYDGRGRRGDGRGDEDGYRSDGPPRRSGRNDRSIDGSADDGRYYGDDYGDTRRRSRRDKSGGRRRSPEDDRSLHDYEAAPSDPRDNDPRAPYPRNSVTLDSYSPTMQQGKTTSSDVPNSFDRASYPAAGIAAMASPPALSPQPSRPPQQQSGWTTGESPSSMNNIYPSTASPSQPTTLPSGMPPPPPSPSNQPSRSMPASRNGSMAEGYTPYANVYGQPVSSSASSISTPYSRFVQLPPVMPPPNRYQQNAYAQLAPTAAAAGAGAAYNGQGGYYGAGLERPWDPRRDGEYDNNNDGYYDRSPSRSPRSHRSGRRVRTPSYDSYDSREDDKYGSPPRGQSSDQRRRTNSERRPSDTTAANGNGNKYLDAFNNSKTKIRAKGAFDTSQRGLGYGAVGALAGGLLGSEVGKGNKALPIAIGAAMGALGANAFEARERRKDYTRHDQYDRDGTYARGAAKRRTDTGYYSD